MLLGFSRKICVEESNCCCTALCISAMGMVTLPVGKPLSYCEKSSSIGVSVSLLRMKLNRLVPLSCTVASTSLCSVEVNIIPLGTLTNSMWNVISASKLSSNFCNSQNPKLTARKKAKTSISPPFSRSRDDRLMVAFLLLALILLRSCIDTIAVHTDGYALVNFKNKDVV